MGIFNRMSNGWQLAVSSIKVLNANKQLIIFPLLSGLSVALAIASFGTAVFARAGWDSDNIHLSQGAAFLLLFLFYILNYFFIVFFNMALMYCAKSYFDGQEVSIAKGLRFSAGRVHIIFLWAVFSATFGVLLRVVQNNLGWLGRIITAGIGLVWSIATFLVVPVLAYENLGPVDAVERSAQLMKEKWGESIGASFSFSLMLFFPLLAWIVIAYGISYYASDAVGIALFVTGFLLMFVISSALQSIFISALYNNINGNITAHFKQDTLDGCFEQK